MFSSLSTSLLWRGILVSATARAATGTEGGSADCLPSAELSLELLTFSGADVLRGRQSHSLLELSLQVVRAHARVIAEQREGNALVEIARVLIDVVTRALNGAARRFRSIGSAPLARADCRRCSSALTLRRSRHR